MKERIKIRRDTMRESDISASVDSAVRLINSTLKTELEAIGVELSNETLDDCFGNGSLIAKDYQQRLSKDLQTISIPSIRSMMEKNAQIAFRKFNDNRRPVVDKIGRHARSYITVENGWAVFSDEDQKRLGEECDIYLEDKGEIELYRKHLAACEALNAMFKGYISRTWQELFDFENRQFCPAAIHYDILLKNIKQNGNNK